MRIASSGQTSTQYPQINVEADRVFLDVGIGMLLGYDRDALGRADRFTEHAAHATGRAVLADSEAVAAAVSRHERPEFLGVLDQTLDTGPIACGQEHRLVHTETAVLPTAHVLDDYVDFQIRSRGGDRAVSFTPEHVDRILASLRPFEGRRSEAASFTRRAEAVEKSDEPGKEKKAVLWRLAAFRLLPDAGNAEALLQALRTQSEPTAGAELKRLAEDIAERINSSAPEKERLLKAAKGS